MKPLYIAVAACSLCALPAFSQGNTCSAGDQKFVDFAAQTDMTEAHLGQVAQDKAESQGVKDYAQMLNTDHTKDYGMLQAAAQKAGCTVPQGLDAKHNTLIAPLEKLKGKTFDTRFIHTMVTGHEQAIAEYKKEANDLQNADLKTYAQTALPVLQKHLDGAKDLAKPAAKGNTAATQ